MPSTTYTPPGVAITFGGPQTPLLTGPAPKTVGILADFPKGPDYVTIMQSTQLPQYYGDPTQQQSVGYRGVYLGYFSGQQQAPGGGAVQFAIARGGVVRGQYVVLDGVAGTTMTLKATGVYAGSAAQFLQVSITVATGKVTSITFSDSRTNLTVGTTLADVSIGGTYDLSTNANIVAAINSTNPTTPTALGSVCVATLGASAVVPAVVTNAAFTAGTDGKGVTYNDTTIGSNGSGGLLDQLLAVGCDYIVCGFDAATIGPNLLAHLNAATAANAYRKAVLGPARATTFASLSAGTYLGGSLQNSRLVVLGHDALTAIHPATGAQYTWDGFYGAAAIAGLKASGPTHETAINFAVNGFQAVAPPSDKPAGLAMPADYNTLSLAGFTTLMSTPSDPTLRMRDSLTTAPMTINGSNQQNLYSQWNIQDIDDAVAYATVQALSFYKGRPMAPDTPGHMLADVTGAVNELGPVTNGLNADGTNFAQDPVTGNIQGTVSYRTRLGIRTIPITTGFTAT